MKLRSRGLVLAQLVLVAGLLWPGALFNFNSTGVGLATAGAMLGLWALTANRPGNFRVMPELKSGALLIQTGPYSWVRHPMYTAVLLMTLGGLICQFNRWRLLAWLGLFVVLCLKSAREEVLLMSHFPDYKVYRANTGRFLPGLWDRLKWKG